MTTTTDAAKMAKLVEYLRTRATITTVALPEDIPVRGNSLDSGDPALDKQEEDRIIDDLEWNKWAWFIAHVQARYLDHTGAEYLGGCSYKSREDFEAPGGYHEDMVNAALHQLAHAIMLDAKAWADMAPLLETETRDAEEYNAKSPIRDVLVDFAELVLQEMQARGHGSKDPGRCVLSDGLARDGFRILAKEARKRGLL